MAVDGKAQATHCLQVEPEVNQGLQLAQALLERLTHPPQLLAEQQHHPDAAAVVVVQPRQQMALLVVRAHSPVVAVVLAEQRAQASWVAQVALAVRDIARSTHGKLIRHN